MKYRFRATRAFWRSFGKLPAQQQRRAREAFLIFKQNPFDSRLGSHKIQSFLLAMVASFAPPKSRRISESCSTCAPPISTCRFAHLCRSSPLGSIREQESSPATAGRLSTAFNIRTAEKSAKVTSRREIAPRYEDREQDRSRAHSGRVSR